MRCANQSRQASGTSPAGQDAEHDLRQSDFRLRIAGGHPIAAGECEFGAAAHAEAVDGGDRRAAQSCQILVHALAIFDHAKDAAWLLVKGLELVDIRAGNKATGLSRTDHHAFRSFERQALDNLRQLVHDFARQGVDGCSGTVESQYDDAIRIGLGLPVIESQSFEHEKFQRGNDGNGYNPCKPVPRSIARTA